MSRELNRIIEDLTRQRLSRRDFIKRASALGLSMGAIGTLLAACGAYSTPAATEATTPEATTTSVATETSTATATEASVGGSAAATDTLVIAASGDIAGWDPATAVFWISNEIVQNTHDVLLGYNTKEENGLTVADPTSLKGDLAESYEFGADGKTLTFKLRDGVKFQNGDPVDAEAIKANFVRFINTPGTGQFLLKDMGLISDPSQIEIVDPTTIRLTAPEPPPLLPKVMPICNLAVSNVKEIDAHKTEADEDALEWAKTHTTGSGPYMVDTWEPGNELVLKANPNYWKGPAKIQKAVYRIVPTPENRLLLLENGDVDMVYEAPLKDIAALQTTPGIRVVSVPTVGNTRVIMNNKMPPFDNKKVRQALAYAVPYDDIINKANYGLATPLTSAVAEGLDYHIDANPYKHDLEKAKALLAEAGYPDGQGLPELKFSLKAGVPEEEDTAIYMQAEFKKIGMNMVIDKMTMAAHEDALHKFELAFTFDYFVPYVPDPVYQLFWNNSPDSPMNYQQYDNPEVTQAIKDALVAVDEAERKALVEKCQTILAEDCAILYLYQPMWSFAMREDVKGYTYYPGHLTRLYDLSKA